MHINRKLLSVDLKTVNYHCDKILIMKLTNFLITNTFLFGAVLSQNDTSSGGAGVISGSNGTASGGASGSNGTSGGGVNGFNGTNGTGGVSVSTGLANEAGVSTGLVAGAVGIVAVLLL